MRNIFADTYQNFLTFDRLKKKKSKITKKNLKKFIYVFEQIDISSLTKKIG